MKNDGIILGTYNKQVVTIPWNTSLPNFNIFVAAGPGAGKTQGIIIPNVTTITDRSMVVTDPKGEIFALTSKIKEKQGYKVFVLNFEDMDCSMRYNPLSYVETTRDSLSISEIIVSAENDKGKKDIWYITQKNLLSSLILYFKYEMPPEKCSIPGILEFLSETDMEEDEDTGIGPLDEVFYSLPSEHPARKAYQLTFAKTKSKMRASVFVSLTATLSNYLDNEVGYFMGDSDFIFDEIGKRKSILYMITPPIDKSWNPLINLAYTQLFDRIYKVAKHNGRVLPIPLLLWLDELPNIGKLEQLQDVTATGRGYGIGTILIVQNITQMQEIYGEKNTESLIGNCATKICLGNCNSTTNEFFSKLCGITTKRVETGSSSTSRSGTSNNSSSQSEQYSFVQANLINQDGVDRMDDDLIIMKATGLKAIQLTTFLAWEHFPKKIMDKYKTEASDFEAYKTKYAKDFLKQHMTIREINPRRRKDEE